MSEEIKRENNVITRAEENYAEKNVFGEFNKVFVSGMIEDEFEFSHEVFWEKFYRTRIRVERFSENMDFIPIVISNLLIEGLEEKSFKGKWVELAGQFRSYNKTGEDGRKHLELYLFVKAINIYEDEPETSNSNMIYLDGYLCKPPVYRTTPSGRDITDLLIAVNRAYYKSDYIPCIAWGRVAKWAGEFEVGNRVRLYGRVQSREYFKRVSPGADAGEWREVYEISVFRMQKVEELWLEDSDNK